MKNKQPIEFEGVNFFCDTCHKTNKGLGYLIDAKGYCEKHFKEKFPEFDLEKGRAFKETIL